MIPLQVRAVNVSIPISKMSEIEDIYYQTFNRLEHLIREAHLTLRDINGPKGGNDKLCTIQIRYYPRGVSVVKSNGNTFIEAVKSACEKMQQAIIRRNDKKRAALHNASKFKPEIGQTYEN